MFPQLYPCSILCRKTKETLNLQILMSVIRIWTTVMQMQVVLIRLHRLIVSVKTDLMEMVPIVMVRTYIDIYMYACK